MRSPAHFWADSTMNKDRVTKDDTPALSFGRAIHMFLLERERFEFSYRLLPETINRRTKDGKAEYAEFLETCSKEGASIVTQADIEQIVKMATSLQHQELEDTNGRIMKLADIFKNGEAETAFVWDDEETGLRCRCKPDWLIGDIVIDYKTCTNASEMAFRRDAGKYRYHIKAAHYMRGLEACGSKPKRFIWLAQEKEAPFCAAPYQVAECDIVAGKAKCSELLRSIRKSIDQGRFDGYSRCVKELPVADWAYE